MQPCRKDTLEAKLQAEVDALRPEVGPSEYYRRSSRTTLQARRSGGCLIEWALAGVDDPVDLFAGPDHVAEVQQGVAQRQTQLLRDLVAQRQAPLRHHGKDVTMELAVVAGQGEVAAGKDLTGTCAEGRVNVIGLE